MEICQDFWYYLEPLRVEAIIYPGKSSADFWLLSELVYRNFSWPFHASEFS